MHFIYGQAILDPSGMGSKDLHESFERVRAPGGHC